MTVTATSIKAMFPEFSSETNDFVNIFINSAKLMICEDMYGGRYDLAVSYLTAHLMKTSKDLGKEVASTKVGDLQRTYNVNGNISTGSYETTAYGKFFLTIKKSNINQIMRPIYGS